MELKHREKTMLYLWRNRINCTVVELKRERSSLQVEKCKVLIVPLWNWNYFFPSCLVFRYNCINCTVVELKLVREFQNAKWHIRINCTVVELKPNKIIELSDKNGVLIVPLWNWNVTLYYMLHMRFFVLIVPLWNWNIYVTC